MPTPAPPPRAPRLGEGPSPVAWGLLVAACCAALLLAGPVYDTNDDPTIVDLLAGAHGAVVDVGYLGRPLSAALRALYRSFPELPWYGLLIASCGALSAGLWGALAAASRMRPPTLLAATAGLLVGCSYLMLRVNFMAASFSLFLAAAAWLWRLQMGRGDVRARQALLGGAMGLAYLLRPSLQWILLFFALPCLTVSAGSRNLRRLLLVGACAGILVLAAAGGERRRHADPAARDLAALNRARSAMIDLPRDPTPAALTAAGWTPGDYELALRFGVYDEELYRTERIRAFLAAADRAPWLERHVRTARSYLLARFHLICLATLLCVLWLLRAEGGVRADRRPAPAVRAFVWAWIGAGTLALAVNRFPPRAFVPLYLYLGALACLVPPPLPRSWPARRAAGALRAAALGTVGTLLCLVLVFWIADGRAGRARLKAQTGELRAAAAAAGPSAIFVPVGPLLETQYTGALAPPAPGALPRLPPGGWAVATPALKDFLARTGFASGQAFMRGLVDDPRMVFAVRRDRQGDAGWLVARLGERYAPGRRLTLEPLRGFPGGPSFLFFTVRDAGDRAGPGVL